MAFTVGMKGAVEGFNAFHIPEPNSGCWLWTASLNNKGYGLLQRGGFKGYAHRFAYQHLVAGGADISGAHVCHRCDNPCCVNPDHLFLGSQSDNMADCVSKGRHASQRNATNYAKGERQAHSKLSVAQVIEIRASTLSQRKLAAQFGVSKNSIKLVQQRRTWTHV